LWTYAHSVDAALAALDGDGDGPVR
jgi:hypothetical protein